VGNPALNDSGVWHGRQKELDSLVVVTWHGAIYGHHTAYLCTPITLTLALDPKTNPGRIWMLVHTLNSTPVFLHFKFGK
jgi:hypothetical protein